jgi:hypothetical protein
VQGIETFTESVLNVSNEPLMKMRQDKNSGTRYVEVGMYTVESSHEFCMELFALNNES